MPKKTRAMKYQNLLDIPEGKIGDHEISHLPYKAGESFPLVTARTAIMGGHRGRSVAFPTAGHLHQLAYSGGVWMTDKPVEVKQHYDCLARIKTGTVLVGGLGLGLTITILAQRKGIRHIVVVEQSADVLKLVAPYSPPPNTPGEKVEFIHGDLFEYLKSGPGPFDWAFYDIWQRDGEGTFHEVVVPLLKLSETKVKNRPVCWNEDVMRGQLTWGLDGRLRMLNPDFLQHFSSITRPSLEEAAQENGNMWHDWSAPFFRWVMEDKPQDAVLRAGLWFYGQHYGEVGFYDRWTAFKAFTPK